MSSYGSEGPPREREEIQKPQEEIATEGGSQSGSGSSFDRTEEIRKEENGENVGSRAETSSTEAQAPVNGNWLKKNLTTLRALALTIAGISLIVRGFTEGDAANVMFGFSLVGAEPIARAGSAVANGAGAA